MVLVDISSVLVAFRCRTFTSVAMVVVGSSSLGEEYLLAPEPARLWRQAATGAEQRNCCEIDSLWYICLGTALVRCDLAVWTARQCEELQFSCWREVAAVHAVATELRLP